MLIFPIEHADPPIDSLYDQKEDVEEMEENEVDPLIGPGFVRQRISKEIHPILGILSWISLMI